MNHDNCRSISEVRVTNFFSGLVFENPCQKENIESKSDYVRGSGVSSNGKCFQTTPDEV